MAHNSDSHTAKTIEWNAVFGRFDIGKHNFDIAPFPISAKQINSACRHLSLPKEINARMLCKQDTRESRPEIFQELGLFLLPIKSGQYVIVKGEGYADIPPIESSLVQYNSSFPFELETTRVGDSEMQHLDRAYALSLIRHFAGDASLVLTIRGRKYTPNFDFRACGFSLSVDSVQTEVDGGYEGENQIVLVEAKILGPTTPSSGKFIIRSASGKRTRQNPYQRCFSNGLTAANITSGNSGSTPPTIIAASGC